METDGDVSVILPLPPSKAQARTSKPTLEKSLRRTGYTFDERMLLHRDPDDDHPEQPARIEGILEQLQEAGLLERCTRVLAGEFPNEAALATHSSEHLDFVNDLARADKELLAESSKSLDSLYLCRESEISAKAAVACTAGLAVEIALGKLSNGFAIVRPPGHHAEPEEAMGFCILNNVAVAVKELMRLGLAKKVMILDWDVHHGNGTQKVFEEDQNVLFISIHRHDRGTFYPSGFAGSPACVGADPAKGFSINIGWNGPGYTDADYLAAFYRVVMPIAMEFSPDFIFVSAGFDAADGDPIGECLVTPRGFAQMTQLLLGVAAGRVLLVLEGGYNIPVISSCAEACTRTLLGDPIPLDTTTVRPTASLAAMAAIDETINFQSDYWKSLYPRYYNVPERASGVFTIQHANEVLWSSICVKSFDMIPLPVAELHLQGYARDRAFITDDVLERPRGIIVFAHESGALYSKRSDSNMSSMKKSVIHQPYFGYIKEARRDKWAVIDIQVPAKLWRLKQTQTGSSEDLALLNDLLLYIWDNFLVLSDTDNIFFVSSGLPSYAVCHLLDKRITSTKVRGVVVLSPTLYLPVASPDRSEWYGINSLVIIPTKRPIGTPIATNASFGSCLSSGSDDPAEINSVISDCQDRVFSFIRSRSDQNWPGLSTA